MRLKFSVDRVDENANISVCFDENETKYEFPAHLVGLEAGMLFYATLDQNGLPTDIEPLPKETAERRRALHSRTSALFRRNKNN